MNILISNYGNDSIALIQWAFLNAIANVTVVSWDTGWHDDSWPTHVNAGAALAQRCGFTTHILKARVGFSELVTERGEFPTSKFQWCATLLKGVPLLQWLGQVDPTLQAQVLLPARRQALPAYAQLSEKIDECEQYGGRAAWHPLLDIALPERDALITSAGFPILSHRSLECDPCIHSGQRDFARLSPASCIKTAQLENNIGKVMFPIPEVKQAVASDINSLVARAHQSGINDANNLLPTPHSGCGAPYGCGI